MGKRVDTLLDGLLPGPCACEEVDARRLIDEAAKAALLDASDYFMQRDGATSVVEWLLRTAHEVPVPEDGES